MARGYAVGRARRRPRHLNAKWIHASFGLRYLRANLGELRERR